MMKNRMLVSALALLPLLTVAQEEFTGEIRWGQPIELKKQESSPDPIGLAGGNLYMHKGKYTYALNPKKTQHFLQTYDPSTLQMTTEVQMNMLYNGHSLVLTHQFIFNDRPMFISSYAEDNRKIYILHEINNGKVVGERVIAEAKDSYANKRVVNYVNSLKRSTFSTMLSEDRRTLMVLYTDEITEENPKPDLNTIVYDSDLNEVSRGILDLKDYIVESMRLLNDGRTLILGFEAVEGEKIGLIKKRETWDRGQGYAMFYDGTKLEKTTIDIGHNVHSLSAKLKGNGDLVVYGLYTVENEKGVSGAFFVQMDGKANVKKVSTKAFETDFMTQYWTENQREKTEKPYENGKENPEPVFYNYVIHDLIVKENGEMTLLAEQYYKYMTTHTTTVNGTRQTNTIYHYVYDDILAVNCTEEGDIDWVQSLKKRQHTMNDEGYYSSFFISVQGNGIHLIYNNSEAGMDEEELAGMSAREKKKARRNVLAAIYSIGEDGNVTHKKLFDFEEEQARRLVPRACAKMSDNEILLFTNNRATDTPMLGWLTL